MCNRRKWGGRYLSWHGSEWISSQTEYKVGNERVRDPGEEDACLESVWEELMDDLGPVCSEE